ncbi:MAG: hypothetical protein IJE21_07930 [Alistipes sp.]|nr:hypothetical protein [Alistipes sp.]
MKKFLILVAFVMSLSCVTLSVKAQCVTIGIPEVVDKTRGLPLAVKSMLRNSFTDAVNSVRGYAAYDRTSDIDTVLDEHMFQQSGLVRESSIKQIKMTGVRYLLLSEASIYDGKLYVTAKIMNVETARVVATEDIIMYNHAMGIKQGCKALAQRLLGVVK